jgi:transposase
MNPSPHNGKEARRLQAWHLQQQGWSQRQIATALGVSEGAVSQWMTRGREGGSEALRHRPPPAARCRLTAEQLAGLPVLLQHGPEAYGFRGQLWTRGRIAAVMRAQFGASDHPCHGGRLGKAIRWSPPKPARRARQRDEAAMLRWHDETWPAINRGRKPRGTRSSSSMNPASIPDPHVARTYAPVGQTPILRAWWTRDHLSAIRAIAPEGKLYFHCQDRALASEDVVAFLEHLRREVSGRRVII